MASEAQIEANRRNAQKSTGPKTIDGKSAAARNALRHGMTAKDVVCADEKTQNFTDFVAEMRTTLAPADAVEEDFVERITLATWRLRRVARAECGLIDSWYEAGGRSDLRDDETAMSRVFSVASHKLIALSRYEIGLDRMLGRTYARLERRQATRRGETVPVPVSILVETAIPFEKKPKSENYETNPIVPVAPEGVPSQLEAPDNDALPGTTPESQ